MCIIDAIINVNCYYLDELPVFRDLGQHWEAMGSPRECDCFGGVAAEMWWVSLRVGLRVLREARILGRNVADYGLRVERGASGTSDAESVNWA